MTFEQIIRELRATPPCGLNDWMVQRSDQIAALPKLQRECVETSIDLLRKWLVQAAVITAFARDMHETPKPPL
jgi:hypothetical protein